MIRLQETLREAVRRYKVDVLALYRDGTTGLQDGETAERHTGEL